MTEPVKRKRAKKISLKKAPANRTGAEVARLVKPLERYLNDVGIYELSAPVGRQKSSFVILSYGKGISGPVAAQFWAADRQGAFLDAKPIAVYYNVTKTEAFEKLGFFFSE